MRKSICELTKPSARRELRLAGISTSTTADVHIRVLTTALQIKPTSTRCHSAWQPKPGRGSTYRRGDFVQTNGTGSEDSMKFRPLHDRVVVKRIDAEEKTTGGIIIPDSAKEKHSQGEITPGGPGG